MSKINRYDGDLKAFGADSVSTERTVFGDTTQSDSLDDNLNTDFFRGWGIVGVNDFPPREWFNAIGFSLSQILAYLHQMGIAEWNTAQEYHAGSACIDGAGKVYISKIANNTGNALPADEDSNWKRVLDFSDLNDTALTGNPTAPTQASGNNSTRLATTAFVKEKSEIDSIGVNQNWTNVTGSRAFNVTYTNSTGKPIKVCCYMQNSGDALLVLQVNGVTMQQSRSFFSVAGIKAAYVSEIVPNGSTYNLQNLGIGSISGWFELR